MSLISIPFTSSNICKIYVYLQRNDIQELVLDSYSHLVFSVLLDGVALGALLHEQLLALLNVAHRESEID